MHKKYAKALFEILKGASESELADKFSAFAEYLKKSGKAKLLPKVLRELERILQKEAKNAPKVYFAKDADESKAKEIAQKLSIDSPEFVKDEKLIGGVKVKSGTKLYDASYKKYLLDLYEALKA